MKFTARLDNILDFERIRNCSIFLSKKNTQISSKRKIENIVQPTSPKFQ